ncbi:MAG TPA: tryptophan-rich sensory protein [Candidatus Paceibacterota bacterium]|jgi:hypothetical protein|nr:tryptophan-rich sensory protein [Candidatus Paceibacterota bacterium]
MKKEKLITKIFVPATFLAMIIVNFLANFLPINNMSTGGVSELYPNLFTPAPLTFSIWGIIYFLVALYVLYQLGLFKKVKRDQALLSKVGFYFSISSIANIIWIFFWHYDLILLSFLTMLVLLSSLIKMVSILREEKLDNWQKLLVKTPFSVYLGWISVATIANFVVLMKSLNFSMLANNHVCFTILMLSIGAIVGLFVLIKKKDMLYGLVFIWAYLGIYIKHTGTMFYDGTYSRIIFAVSVYLILFVMAELIAFFGLKEKQKTLIEKIFRK